MHQRWGKLNHRTYYFYYVETKRCALFNGCCTSKKKQHTTCEVCYPYAWQCVTLATSARPGHRPLVSWPERLTSHLRACSLINDEGKAGAPLNEKPLDCTLLFIMWRGYIKYVTPPPPPSKKKTPNKTKQKNKRDNYILIHIMDFFLFSFKLINKTIILSHLFNLIVI